MCTYMFTYIYIYVYLCMCRYTLMYVCICMHVCIYTCINEVWSASSQTTPSEFTSVELQVVKKHAETTW